VIEVVLSELERRGFRGRVVSVSRLGELREEFDSRRRDGLLDEGVVERYLSHLSFDLPEELPDARSIIVVAVPQPSIRFTFAWKGRRVSADVPPTYFGAGEVNERVVEAVNGSTAPESRRLIPAIVPRKLLAVRSGLAAYGRNNVAYVPGMGSMHRIAAFFSDIPVEEDGWGDAAMLPRCRECEACRRACPTGAVGGDRFLLHAERCITYYNEEEADVPFPSWLEPSWHDLLIGCFHCQRVCPENREYVDRVEEREEFSEEEVALLLAGTPPEEMPAATAGKLARSELGEIAEVLPRNLKILLERDAA
jgi:epoxyqueuosine reductase